ncbi:MAG: hypothetical protein Q7T30_02380, partial [Planctomycetota bacterium]|nr:hypothetical protein [Planctomycetota bacterium]
MNSRLLSFALCTLGCAFARAQAPASTAAATLPVREATVFKDGHAYLLRETTSKPDAQGHIVLDELPVPVLGTFWPYTTGAGKLVSAKAGRDTVSEEKAAVDLRQIARANVGKDVVVVDQNKERIEGKLLAVPARDEKDAAPGELLLVATANGTRAVQLAQVRDLEIQGDFTSKLRVERQ